MNVKYQIRSVELQCPYCEETILHPSTGSMYWDVNELPQNRKVECVCGKTTFIPKALQAA